MNGSSKHKAQPDTPLPAYADADGNVYRVEKATNGMWVCVRRNAGGNRKGFKHLDPDKRQAGAQAKLDAWASGHKWKAIKP